MKIFLTKIGYLYSVCIFYIELILVRFFIGAFYFIV